MYKRQAVILVGENGHFSFAPFGIGLALYVMGGALIDLIERTGLARLPFRVAVSRARGLPRSAWGGGLAHFGIGLTLLGIVCEAHWGAERIVNLSPSQSVALRHYELTLEGIVPRQGPNYREQVARFSVRKEGTALGMLEPSKRTFPTRNMTTTEAALLTRGASQLYVSLGELGADGSIAVRIYHKPLVLLIWLGALVMALGGALSLSDRRLRVGAPKPAAKAHLAAAE